MTTIKQQCLVARNHSGYIGMRSSAEKNRMLQIIADSLVQNAPYIIQANQSDVAAAVDKPAHFIDRLTLTEKRIEDMAKGLEALIALPDPIGEIDAEWKVASGLRIQKVRVPLGLIAIIYEARPNVTADAIGLCLKTGNAIVLRGSKDALKSNATIVKVIKNALKQNNFNPEFIQFINDASREGASALMQCSGIVDVLIPRGSAGLIKTVVENSSIPVIQTGAGNCHAYVHASADLDMAEKIILNGKLSRPAVCNALESLLIDKEIAKEFLPRMVAALITNGVEIVGCEQTVKICKKGVTSATEEDYYEEFLALKIAVKVVENIQEAIDHINRYGTMHSETIIARDKDAAEYFLNAVDSAAVYHNASTRFTDGFEFGFGAEMGISTQKLHARGPMGLKELTSLKYKIFGSGNVR
ncbi:MAG: glutamate-5-semialdehyde dehydrogenase [Firmicutes bacterium]|nr:glutamate-5-semialdehyde dehydrogenase [Bacillota bacterium]